MTFVQNIVCYLKYKIQYLELQIKIISSISSIIILQNKTKFTIKVIQEKQEKMIQNTMQNQNLKVNSGNSSKDIVCQSLKPDDILQPVKDLTKIFPDIEGELCSRHSTLFGKLKYTFNKLYDGFQPAFYVVVKGNTHIIGNQYEYLKIGEQQKNTEILQQTQTSGQLLQKQYRQTAEDEVELSMALQNGIIILVAKTYQKSKIFINGNHIDQQLIFNEKGELEEGLYQYSQQFQTICKASIQNVEKSHKKQGTQNALYGGIMYIHANIPENFYNYKSSLLTGLYIAGLMINNCLQKFTISELINQITKTSLVDDEFLEKQFYDYYNRQLSLMVGQNMYKIPLDNEMKLLFCRLDLANCDIKHSQTNIKYIENDKTKIIKILNTLYGVKSFYELFENLDSLGLNVNQGHGSERVKKILEEAQSRIKRLSNCKSTQTLEMTNKSEIDQYIKLINAELRQLSILCQYSNNKQTFQSLIKIKWMIDSQLRGIFSQQVVQLVESIRQKLKIQACTVIERQYLMMVVERQKYTEVICKLRHLLHKGELKSKSCFKLEQDVIQTRWGSDDNGISQKIFVSVPSRGIAVFQPTEAIWFD